MPTLHNYSTSTPKPLQQQINSQWTSDLLTSGYPQHPQNHPHSFLPLVPTLPIPPPKANPMQGKPNLLALLLSSFCDTEPGQEDPCLWPLACSVQVLLLRLKMAKETRHVQGSLCWTGADGVMLATRLALEKQQQQQLKEVWMWYQREGTKKCGWNQIVINRQA